MYNFIESKDVCAVVDLINASEYYGRVHARDLAGTHLYGMMHEGMLVACVMVLRTGAQAYLDYLCVDKARQGAGVGTALLVKTIANLHRHKVVKVHACISGENAVSMKLMQAYNAKIGWPYMNVVVNLEDENG